jgi:hypothetical protein
MAETKNDNKVLKGAELDAAITAAANELNLGSMLNYRTAGISLKRGDSFKIVSIAKVGQPREEFQPLVYRTNTGASISVKNFNNSDWGEDVAGVTVRDNIAFLLTHKDKTFTVTKIVEEEERTLKGAGEKGADITYKPKTITLEME